jgi:hypothetical protein
MKKEFLLVLFISLILISQVDTRKKKKKSKNETSTEVNPLDRKPDRITKEHYCDVCQAIIRETTKRLRNLKLESDVMEKLTDVCSQKYYSSYRKELLTI